MASEWGSSTATRNESIAPPKGISEKTTAPSLDKGGSQVSGQNEEISTSEPVIQRPARSVSFGRPGYQDVDLEVGDLSGSDPNYLSLYRG
jgi:hypothetical protein